MHKKLLNLSRLLSLVLLISTFLLISACIKIVPPTSTAAANTTSSTSTTIQNNYTLTIQTTGQGSESASPVQTTYTPGTVAYLTATPATGWTFSGWSGSNDIANPTANSTTITINGNESVTATFIQSNYILNTSVIGNGSIGLNDNGPYHYGDVVQLTATPAAGWIFANWSGDAVSSTTATMVITINSDTNVIANFVAIRYSLSTSVSPSGGGSVSPSSGSYAYGSSVTLTATSATGYQFSSWSGDVSGSSSAISISMNSNTNIVANFSAINYTLSISVSPSGSGSVTSISPSSSGSGGNYVYDSNVTLTATPATGFQFSSWSGDISSSSQTVNVTMYSNKNVTATFTQIVFTPEPINYNMPGNGILGFSVWWTNYLNAGTEIKGTVSLSGSTPGGIDWSSNWIFEIDDPLGNVAFSQSYTLDTGSVKTFDFITKQAGTWKIKVSDASNFPRTLQITISPSGW